MTLVVHGVVVVRNIATTAQPSGLNWSGANLLKKLGNLL